MSDPYASMMTALDSPAVDAFTVTPNDSTDLAVTPRALWVGIFGDIVIITLEGTTVTIKGIQGLLPVRASRVLATGTTATDIVGLV